MGRKRCKNKNVHCGVIYNGEKRRNWMGQVKYGRAEQWDIMQRLSVVSDMFFVTWENATKKFMFRKIPVL